MKDLKITKEGVGAIQITSDLNGPTLSLVNVTVI